MYLRRLTLRNVRQFDHQTLDFRPGFNLLVGENGSGKTTILRGVLAALGAAGQRRSSTDLKDADIRLRTDRAEANALVDLGSRLENFHFQKTLWESGTRLTNGRGKPLVLCYSSSESTCSSLKIRETRGPRRDDGGSLRSSEEFLYEAELRDSRAPRSTGTPAFGSSGSVRRFVGRILSTFSPEMSDFSWRFEPYDCSLVAEPAAEKSQPLEPAIRRLARDIAMRAFQEGMTNRQPFNWPDQRKIILKPDPEEGRRDGLRLPNPDLIWKDAENLSEPIRRRLMGCSIEVKLTPRIMIGRRIGMLALSQLSDGEQRLFSLFVDIARQLSLRNPTGEINRGEAIVLIDEIDVHLHPKWQRRIVPALEDLFAGCQFIATTHSPFVIQAASRHHLISMDNQFSGDTLEARGSIEDIAEIVQGIHQPQRSLRAEELDSAAKRYFSLLQTKAHSPQQVSPRELQSAKVRYRKASEPYASNPAVNAFLRVMALQGDSE